MDPYPSGVNVEVNGPSQPTAWQLIKSSWQSENRFPAYLFFSIVLVMTVSFVCLDMVFTYLYYHFYDVLQTYDKHGMLRLLSVLLLLSLCYLMVGIYRFYVSKRGVRWRRMLAERYIGRWLLKRKGEEVAPLINFSIDLSLGLISVITTFIIFIYMLLLFTEDLNISFGAWGNVELSRLLVSLGFVYAILGTLRALKRGQAFSLNFIFGKRIVALFQAGFYQVSLVLPLLVVLPGCFDKIFLLSWLIQSLQSFSRVQVTLSSIVNSYPLTPKMNGTDPEMILK